MKRLTGARPSPRHRLAAASPHVHSTGITPPQFLWRPSKLSMWLNDTYGDCVTAEEAFAKATHAPEIFVPDTEVYAWANTHGDLNGAELTSVMDTMLTSGFVVGSSQYRDGPATAVDWTNAPLLHDAIALGPVKIGVASSQLQTAAPDSDPLPNGWFCSGFMEDVNEDHCTSLCGYGTLSWLAGQLGVHVPSGVNGAAAGYGLFTWGSIAIIDQPSMLAITGEAWLRNPTTIIVPAS